MEFEIKTNRLTLVPLSPAYREVIFKEFTPEVAVFMAPSPAQDMSGTDSYIAKAQDDMESGRDIVCAVLLTETQEFLGCAGLHGINTKTPELGIWIKVSAHGYKYGLEAMVSLKAWADEHLQYDYILYPVVKENIASAKIPIFMGGTVAREYDGKNYAGIEMKFAEYHIPPSR